MIKLAKILVIATAIFDTVWLHSQSVSALVLIYFSLLAVEERINDEVVELRHEINCLRRELQRVHPSRDAGR